MQARGHHCHRIPTLHRTPVATHTRPAGHRPPQPNHWQREPHWRSKHHPMEGPATPPHLIPLCFARRSHRMPRPRHGHRRTAGMRRAPVPTARGSRTHPASTPRQVVDAAPSASHSAPSRQRQPDSPRPRQPAPPSRVGIGGLGPLPKPHRSHRGPLAQARLPGRPTQSPHAPLQDRSPVRPRPSRTVPAPPTSC